MITLHIEHAISDLPTWKAAFDQDPARRSSRVCGVTGSPNLSMTRTTS
jgi:hypothetical protein